MKRTNVNPNVALDRPDDPSESPRSRGQTKRKELEHKDPDTIFVPNTKGKEFVVRPEHGNAVEGIGDVRRTPPHGPRNGTDNALNCLHSEFGNPEVKVEVR